MEKVGIRQLRNQLSHYLKQVKQGEGVIVTDRGTYIAILPPAAEMRTDETFKRLVSLGFASWQGGKPKGAANPPRVRGKSAAQIVLEERG